MVDEFFSGFLGGFFLGVEGSEFIVPFGCLIWLLTTIFILRRIEENDAIIGLLFLLITMINGVILILALPQHFLTSTPSFFLNFKALVFCSVVSMTLWVNRVWRSRRTSAKGSAIEKLKR
jgi:low temperature requirement protein LtrA